MIDIILLIPLAITFIASVLLAPYWIRKAREIGLVWDDMNKYHSEKVSGSGGIIVILSFVIGIFTYIGYRTFHLGTQEHLVEIFGVLTVVILLGGIGFIDDLLGWRKGGLSIRSRILLVLFAAIPLIVINVGRGQVSIPFFGYIQLGIIYPLVLVPLGILGATTVFNILAGFNSLEAGQGTIILSAMAIIAWLQGESWISATALIMVLALLGFMIYNLSPAQVFPGDSLTYAVGGLIAIIPILGNFEKIGFFFFIPYFIEAILKLKGGLKKYSFGKPNSDGTLGQRYDRFYSLNHVALYVLTKLGIKPKEENAVYCLWIFQIMIIILGVIIFRKSLFI
jgi:UDP-N-acetylglucosamine--dolichyl-phosphate N-acetylglucosaminephosphotransferase